MASLAERLGDVVEREAPVWGIRRVPPAARRFSGLDLAVLWGDLSVGILVMVTGALLVPAMGLPRALLAIVVGSAIGCAPLALVGAAGEREGLPTMVLFRPILGRLGSYVPSALNVVQLVGWTAVEFWAMSEVANVASTRLFSVDSSLLWLVVVAVVCTALALGGPILVVRRWLERFGIYVLLGVSVWITVRVLTAADVGALWRGPGGGGLPFWLAVDLVVVMPISWLPLVADYNRFAIPGRGGAVGTYVGYFAGNVWFYSLGALAVLAVGATADVPGIGTAIATVAGGSIVLLALLVGESDNAFADIYSSAVSMQNVLPRISERMFVLGVGALAFVLALLLSVERYEVFLFLIGSVFVPLFGVFVADYVVLRGARFVEDEPFDAVPWRWVGFAPWIVGFLVYHWCVAAGTMPQGWTDAMRWLFTELLGLPFPLFDAGLGASLPSFAVAFVLALLVGRVGATRRPLEVGAGERRPAA
jgi:putative hydroxymethylpyrimidine transporter CytX